MNFVRFRGWFGLSQPRFLLRVCAGRRDAFFSNWSVCRCALSAFVRFSDMRIVSHRSWTLGHTWGRASLRLICCGMRDALVDRKHELKRLLLRVPASAPLRHADHVEAAGVALFECVCELDLEGTRLCHRARAEHVVQDSQSV